MSAALNIKTPAQEQRYATLHELRRVRAAVRIGTTSTANASKERLGLVRVLAKLREGRKTPG